MGTSLPSCHLATAREYTDPQTVLWEDMDRIENDTFNSSSISVCICCHGNVLFTLKFESFICFCFQSPEMLKIKLKLLELEFEEEMKQKTERLKPRLLGCIWIDSKTSDYGMLFVTLLTRFLFQCFNPEINMQPISRSVCSCLKCWGKWHALFQGIWLHICVHVCTLVYMWVREIMPHLKHSHSDWGLR
jgi:hypothetical protein